MDEQQAPFPNIGSPSRCAMTSSAQDEGVVGFATRD
jgi:hypothetical protein